MVKLAVRETMTRTTMTREAFTEFIEQHYQDVRAYLCRYLRSGDMADDLAQEVFLQAYRNWESFAGRSAPTTWLLAIARHRVLDHLRQESRRRRRDGRLLEAALADKNRLWVEGEDLEETARELDALRACIEHLPDHTGKLVRAHYLDQQSAQTLANEQGKKGNAIRMMLLRARRALGRCIRQRLNGGEK